MYANRKGWNLTDIKVEVAFDKDPTESKSKIMRNIQLFKDLDNAQKARLLNIADRCPTHKILTNPKLRDRNFKGIIKGFSMVPETGEPCPSFFT
jgi:uncharacterized OsmC-like protein